MQEIHNELEVDIAAYSEHQLNMKNKKNCNGFNQLFKGGEAAVQSIVAHNVHKILARCSKEVQASLCLGQSQSSLILMRVARMTWVWDAGQ